MVTIVRQVTAYCRPALQLASGFCYQVGHWIRKRGHIASGCLKGIILLWSLGQKEMALCLRMLARGHITWVIGSERASIVAWIRRQSYIYI